MLVKSVHVVDDAERVINGTVPSMVWLESLDESLNADTSDSFYFSLIGRQFIFIPRFRGQERESNRVFVVPSIIRAGEVPGDVVQARPQMVNDLATQHAEPDRNCKVSMIVDRFLPTLSIWIGNDWVFATTEKDTDLSAQIDDVLIRPS